MKKLFAMLALTLGLSFGLAAGSASAAVEIGKTAPDYGFTDITGESHSIAGFNGKTVVLEWHNPGCPFVQKFYNAGEMQRVQAEAQKDSDVVWITVNSSAEGKQGYLTKEDAAKLIAEQKAVPTAYVLDYNGEFGKLYGAKTTPHMYVIDKDGNLAYQGAIDSIKSADSDDIAKAKNYVMAALAALKKGEKPATTSTEAYGCGVKYK